MTRYATTHFSEQPDALALRITRFLSVEWELTSRQNSWLRRPKFVRSKEYCIIIWKMRTSTLNLIQSGKEISFWTIFDTDIKSSSIRHIWIEFNRLSSLQSLVGLPPSIWMMHFHLRIPTSAMCRCIEPSLRGKSWHNEVHDCVR